MPLMVSLAEQPPEGFGPALQEGGTVRGPRWRIAGGVPGRPGRVSITDGNSIPRSVVPISSLPIPRCGELRQRNGRLHADCPFLGGVTRPRGSVWRLPAGVLRLLLPSIGSAARAGVVRLPDRERGLVVTGSALAVNVRL